MPGPAPIDPLTFRFATQADVPMVVALVESAYRGVSSRVGWTTEADILDGQRVDAAMLVEALADPGTEILLAHDGPFLVACCELHRPGACPSTPAGTKRQSQRPDHATAYLGMFAVDPPLQTSGFGSQLLSAAERIAADDWDASHIELTVIHPREELISWYERRGYAATGELRPFPYGDERFGIPRRDDLRQVVLAKPLGTDDERT